MPRDEDLLLGELAVRQRLCTAEQIAECIRVQAQSREPVELGVLLVYKGYLTDQEMASLLPRPESRILSCPVCGHIFRLLPGSATSSARCPKCRGALELTPGAGSSEPEGEPSPRRGQPLLPRAETSARLLCVICDHAFLAVADPGGRVSCPACQESFRPGKTT